MPILSFSYFFSFFLNTAYLFAADAPSIPQFVDYSSYQDFLCQSKSPSVAPLLLPDFWKQGIYSANIHYSLYSVPNQVFNKVDVVQKSINDANGRLHNGYSYGLCPSLPSDKSSQRFWTLSSPAPILINEKTAPLDLKATLSKNCHKTQVRLGRLDAAKGSDLSLDTLKSLVPKKPSQPSLATLAIYCFPEDTSIGPWLWGLVPQGDQQAIFANLEKKLSVEGEFSASHLLKWINAERVSRKLPELKSLNDELTNALNEIDHKQGIVHKRRTIAEMRKTVERRGFRLLGENRLQASDLKEALTMLWLSPNHRELILHPDISHAAVVVEKLENSENIKQVLFLGLKQREKLDHWLITPPRSLQKRGPSTAKDSTSP